MSICSDVTSLKHKNFSIIMKMNDLVLLPCIGNY
jgi:hypothetical protein